jgi:hypothetical protein
MNKKSPTKRSGSFNELIQILCMLFFMLAFSYFLD